MPIYRYHCNNCGHDFEVRQGFDHEDLTVCEICHTSGEVRRVLTPTGVIFKGKGFYVNDSKGRNSAAPGHGANGHKPPVDGDKEPAKELPAVSKTTEDAGEKSITKTPSSNKDSGTKAAAM